MTRDNEYFVQALNLCLLLTSLGIEKCREIAAKAVDTCIGKGEYVYMHIDDKKLAILECLAREVTREKVVRAIRTLDTHQEPWL